jgi:hypothetical protein
VAEGGGVRDLEVSYSKAATVSVVNDSSIGRSASAAAGKTRQRQISAVTALSGQRRIASRPKPRTT